MDSNKIFDFYQFEFSFLKGKNICRAKRKTTISRADRKWAG